MGCSLARVYGYKNCLYFHFSTTSLSRVASFVHHLISRGSLSWRVFRELFFFYSYLTIFYHIPMYQSSHLFVSFSAKSDTNRQRWVHTQRTARPPLQETGTDWWGPLPHHLRLRTYRIYKTLPADKYHRRYRILTCPRCHQQPGGSSLRGCVERSHADSHAA